MSYKHKKGNGSSDSDDSDDDMKDINLDKDDEDIEFSEEKEIDDDDEDKIGKEPSKKKKKKIDSQTLYPGIKRRKISFYSSSSSSSDELNQKIKKDLLENINDQLTDYQKSQAKSQKELFENNYDILKNDFKIIEEYEQIILKDTSIDIMFIMDLTGSMGAFLSEAKHNIKTITEEISEMNPGAKIRLSFIGYRDFESKEEERIYEKIEFSENLDDFINKIKKFECYGGGDQPEDIAGALNEALKMNWKSNAKYVVLVCDAPCHGIKYHNISYDNFQDGDPSDLVIEDLMKSFKQKEITFYCIKINNSTNKMFDIMKNVYDDDNKFNIEEIGNSAEKLSFFVAFSASELLGNSKYDKCSFVKVLEQFRKDSIDKIMKKYNQKNNNINNNNIYDDSLTQSLINQIEHINLDGEDKKLVEFINRMSNLDLNNKNINKEEDKKDSNNNIDDNNNNDNDYINLEFNQDYFLMNIGNNLSYKINGLTYDKYNIKGIDSFLYPQIIEQSFDTNIQITFGYPEFKNEDNYTIIFNDNALDKNIEGKVPKKVKKEFFKDIKLYAKKICYNDLICEEIADYFNIEIKPESSHFIKFKKDVIYEKVDKTESNNINKIIIGDVALSFPDVLSETPGKRILQTFSHFSYQITYGELIIMDLKYDKDKKRINNYNIYYLKDNGYKKILEFFSSHICNDICKYLGLVHPRKKKNNIEINEQFFSKKYLLKYNLCKCCSIPIRKIKNEYLCSKCACEKIKTIRKKVCQGCHSIFDYSIYEYNSRLTNYPEKCKKCNKL